jgi:NodT family efflux transporter outer membrane factor (OMF) lipoprotein
MGFAACKLPTLVQKTDNQAVPAAYANAAQDSANIAAIKWREYFSDPYLVALIDTALKNNQELNITLQEIEQTRNEIRARKGEYLPFVGLRAGGGVDKVARYTNIGAMEANTEIKPGKEMPEPLPNYMLAATATWELDIWNKLHNAKRAAVSRYLASIEGRNFVITNLIAEVADNYYELLALDNQMDIVKKNIEIQSNALQIVKLQKEATRVTELAVRKFEAEVFKTRSLQYDIQQEITQTENRLNFLLGRFPQPVPRNATAFDGALPNAIKTGIPAQLLANRPDIRQAEKQLEAAKLDVKIARAAFYPSLAISAAVGLQAFNPSYLLQTPESLLYTLAGDLVAPLVNRNAIKAAYKNANARQIQAAYNYERTVLNAYVEVANQMARINNLGQSYELRTKQVQALTQSIDISTGLFRSARADYMEVLMTQRDALESRFDLVETRMHQLNAMVQVYRALGGGWNQ